MPSEPPVRQECLTYVEAYQRSPEKSTQVAAAIQFTIGKEYRLEGLCGWSESTSAS